jgi:cobalt-zinc-cadmium efflux system membrane fusion protein
MNAEIEIDNTKSFVLPEDAVVSYEGKEYIFISKGKNEFTLKRVETGKQENNLIEILNGKLVEKEQIVTKGAYTLLMSLKNKTDE